MRPTFHNGTDTLDLIHWESDTQGLQYWDSLLDERRVRFAQDRFPESVTGHLGQIHVSISFTHRFVLFSFSAATILYGNNLIPCQTTDLPEAFKQFNRLVGLDPHTLVVKRNDNTHNYYAPLPVAIYTRAIGGHPTFYNFQRNHDNVTLSNKSGGLSDYDKTKEMKLATGDEDALGQSDTQKIYDSMGRPHIYRMSNRVGWKALSRKEPLTGEDLLNPDVYAFFLLRHWRLRKQLEMKPSSTEFLLGAPLQNGREYAAALKYVGLQTMGSDAMFSKAAHDIERGVIQHHDPSEWLSQIRRSLRSSINSAQILEWNQTSSSPDPILTFRSELDDQFRGLLRSQGHDVDNPTTYKIESVQDKFEEDDDDFEFEDPSQL